MYWEKNITLLSEFIANLIFGPSYLSQEYVLQYYGLIPERVELITSMTTKRHKHFAPPIGDFRYQYISPKRFFITPHSLLGKKLFALRFIRGKDLCAALSSMEVTRKRSRLV